MFTKEELSQEELEQAVGGLQTRPVNEPLINLEEINAPVKVRRTDIHPNDRDPGHTDP